MEYTFITNDDDLKKYLFNLKEECIIKHEDNWFKEKSHTKLYPNIDEAKAKVAKPYYWILNAIDKYCLLYTSPSPRDLSTSRMPSSA